MEKRIATLDVVVSDNCGHPSALINHRNGTYTLAICQNDDNLVMATTKQDLTAIVAHELGHFLANILHLPKQSKFVAERSMFGSSALEPVEREAWDVADQIRPGVKQSRAFQQSIRSYQGS